jgi:hypothetical protein
LSRPLGRQSGVGRQDAHQRFSLIGFRAGQREPDRQATEGGDQVQAQTPEVARMRSAVPVFGPSGQLGAFDGLAGTAAFDRDGIGHPHVVGPQAGVGGKRPDHRRDQAGSVAQPLVVAGLLGQVPEQMPQMLAGMAQPAGLGGVPEQRLHHCQGHQFSVGQARGESDHRTSWGQVGSGLQKVVDRDIECGGEGVDIIAHNLDLSAPSPTLHFECASPVTIFTRNRT